jgi:hypothetical protein
LQIKYLTGGGGGGGGGGMAGSDDDKGEVFLFVTTFNTVQSQCADADKIQGICDV